MSKYKIAVSVSVGNVDKDTKDYTTHMITYDEVEMSEEQSHALYSYVLMTLLSIGMNGSTEPVFGIYKQEPPAADPGVKH